MRFMLRRRRRAKVSNTFSANDDFAARFPRERRPACHLYLISPLDVARAFPV